MTLEVWLLYSATALVLLSPPPGPSHFLVLSHALRFGPGPVKATIAGDLSANTLQMLAVGLGLAPLIAGSANAFLVIKWLGVGYLVFLAIKLFLRKPLEIDKTEVANPKSLYRQGFLTSATNPKAIVFFGALFPQFLDTTQPLAVQLLVLGATYLVLDGMFLLFYTHFAGFIRNHFQDKIFKYSNRISGSFLMFAAVLLGLKNIGD